MKKLTILLVCLSSVLIAKPVVDLYDTCMCLGKRFYERKNFIFSTYQEKHSDVAVITDTWISSVDSVRKMGYSTVVGFLIEPRAINPASYSFVEKNLKKFDLVITYDKQLIETNPNKCKFAHAMGATFLFTKGIKPKSKLCSIIFSGKATTEGHKLRHEAFKKCKSFLDGYKGPDTPWSRCKGPWLNDYCFSIVIENSQQEHYFTEKLIECFQSGTIPIYWGCPSIGDFFDMDGIIVFNTIAELKRIVSRLSFTKYDQKLDAVRRNYEIAKKYKPTDLDVVWPLIKDRCR